jgi:hypothetical protein
MYTQEISQYNRRTAALFQERSSWISPYREVSDYVQQRRGRYLATNRNKGDKINTKIINPQAMLALRTLKSGLMSGLTSPFRPWFKLGLVDQDKANFRSVKEWLDHCEKVISSIMLKSNLYTTLPVQYEEIGLFGTAPMAINEDYKTVIRGETFTAGEYAIGQDENGRVNIFVREFDMTVDQIVRKFGKENVSLSVRNRYNNKDYDGYVTVRHMICSNDDKVDMGMAQKRPIMSIYWELGSNENKFLEVRGDHEFPIMCPRWDLGSGDTYGRSPGMDALPDSKQLQRMEKKKLLGIDKWADPTMNASPALKNKRTSSLPGDIVYVDSNDKYEPSYIVNPNIDPLSQQIAKVEERIDRAFYADLFLMLANSDRREITAFEIEKKYEEKLLMLGPVYNRMNDENFDPLIKRIFNTAQRNGIIPPQPEELEGEDFNIEYISIMAQAMKAVATTGIERLYGFVGNIAGAKPGVLDLLDEDQTVKQYAEMLGTPATIIRSDEHVKKMREAQAQAQAQQQQMEQMGQSVQGARLLSETDTGNGSNALRDILGL